MEYILLGLKQVYGSSMFIKKADVESALVMLVNAKSLMYVSDEHAFEKIE